MKRIGPLLAMFCAMLLLGAAMLSNNAAASSSTAGVATSPRAVQPAAPRNLVAHSSMSQAVKPAQPGQPSGKPQAPADTPSPTSTPTGCTDIFEPDDNLNEANLLIVGQSQNHTFCESPQNPNNDNDWIKMNLQAYGVYDIHTYNLGAQVDTIIILYDSAGNYITQDDNGGGGLASRIVYTPTASASFFLQMVNKDSLGGFGPDYAYSVTAVQTNQVTPTGTSTNTASPTDTPTPTVTATGSPQPTATPACTDAYEPDNDFNHAQRIGVGESQNHILCNPSDPTFSGDVDYVFFSADAGAAYTIRTKNLANDTETRIELFNTSRQFITGNTFCPDSGDLSACIENISFNSAGVYYVRVFDPRPQGGGLGHTYTLEVTAAAAATTTPGPSQTPTLSPTVAPTVANCLDAYENDGIPAAASLILINTTQHHSFCPAGDADWVKFFAKTGKTYSIFTSNLGPGVDTYMYMFDSSSLTAPIAYNDDSGGSLASRIDFSPVADGLFYVQIKDNGDVGCPECTYDLSLLVAPGGSPATFPPTLPPSGTALPTFTAQPLGSVTPSPESTFTPVPTDTATPPGGQATTLPTAIATVPQTPGPGNPSPTPVVKPSPTATATQAEPTALPFPGTGHSMALADITVRVFVDRSGSGVAAAGEGISNLTVDFIADDGTLDANVTTDASGSSTGIIIPYSYHRISIPYLGIIRDLFSGIAVHDAGNAPATNMEWRIALPPPVLPQRIP